jgi:long-chain acyl-CoA synthetase
MCGERVALLLANGPEFVETYLGIAAVGAVIVPLNVQYQENELFYFMESCGVSVLVTVDEHAALCRRVLSAMVPSPRLVLSAELGAKPTSVSVELPGEVTLSPDAPLMYQFSSGSTGRPKKIARTHRNVMIELDNLVNTFAFTPADRFLGAAPFSHVNGLMRTLLACIRAGGSLYPVPKFERRAVADLIEREAITVFIAVPFMFIMLSRGTSAGKAKDFSSIRWCVSASAPMPKHQNVLFHERFGFHVRQLYGSTETGSISVNLEEDVGNTLESVGTPLPGIEMAIFLEDGQLAPSGEMGEIAVKSASAIRGYEDLDDVNREVFREGYFFTGDMGRMDGSGHVYLMGRKKLFINKGGYKISPFELQTLLEEHPKVEEAVVIGVPTQYGDENVKAFIVPSEPCDAVEIIEYCRGRIADFKIPSQIEFRVVLPKSPAGKVRMQLLIDES